MHGLGTIVNCAAVIVGTIVGILLKNGLSKRFEKIIFTAVGLAVMFIGLSGAMQGLLVIEDGSISTRYTMLMVLSLILGSVLGEALNIEGALERFGERVRDGIPARFSGNNFVEGFVTATMVFCIGAMAIVGSFEDGLSGDHSVLFAKSVLDGITSVLFASTLGVGVAFSVIPLLVYQGGITLLAQVIRPYMSDELILQMSCIGSILIFAIGVNMLFEKKISVANMLPAIFFPIIFMLLKSVWPGLPV